MAALKDDDHGIRWLAGLTLECLRDARVLAAVQAFAERTGSAVERQVAQEWLRRAENEEGI